MCAADFETIRRTCRRWHPSLPGYYILNSAQITKGNLNVNETIEHVEARLEDAVWPDATRSKVAAGRKPPGELIGGHV